MRTTVTIDADVQALLRMKRRSAPSTAISSALPGWISRRCRPEAARSTLIGKCIANLLDLLDCYTKYYEPDIRERLRRFVDPSGADQ